MEFTFEGIKTWVTENPLKAAGIGAGIVAATALLVSDKARKMVGLGGVSHTRSLPPSSRRRGKKGSKRHRGAKNLTLN